MAALTKALHEQKTSFHVGSKHYSFNDVRHMQNTLNKIRREQHIKTTGSEQIGRKFKPNKPGADTQNKSNE